MRNWIYCLPGFVGDGAARVPSCRVDSCCGGDGVFWVDARDGGGDDATDCE